MDSKSENINSKTNINLAIKFIDVKELELNWESLKDVSERAKLQNLFQKIKDEDEPIARAETLDEVREGSIIN